MIGVAVDGLCVRIYQSAYIPKLQPSRWEVWRWQFWSPEEPKPEPREQVLLIGDSVVVSPRTYDELAKTCAKFVVSP